jgi:hypothetical protein
MSGGSLSDIGRTIERAVGYLFERLVEECEPVTREANLYYAPEPGARRLCTPVIYATEAGQSLAHDRLRPVLGGKVRAVLDIDDEGVESTKGGCLCGPENRGGDLGEKLQREIVHRDGMQDAGR